MGDKINLKLDARELQGKKAAKLRKQGIVPAVVYGHGIEPINVQAEYNVIEKVVRQAGKHSPVHLTIDTKKKIALIKDVDTDPVKSRIRHVSFHAVKQNEPVTTEVAIHLIGQGESEAEKNGLIVLQTLEKVEIKALPMDLPEALEADIRALKEPGEKLLLSSVKLPENVELVEHKSGHGDEEDEHSVTELVVASVWEPSALQAANEAAAGDGEADTEVEAEQGGEDLEGTQDEESKPGGKLQDEPKQSNVDANK